MVDGTRTALSSLPHDVKPRQPERMQLVGGQGRRMESSPRWADGDEEEDEEEEETRGWMSRRYGSMIPQPAFHGLTRFAHEAFSLTHLSAFLFCSFSNLLVSVCICVWNNFFMPLLLLPPLRRARDEHTHTHTPHLERPVFFLLLRVPMMFSGHSRQPGLYIMSPPHREEEGGQDLRLFFLRRFSFVCCVGVVWYIFIMCDRDGRPTGLGERGKCA